MIFIKNELTASEVADLCGLSQSTVRYWIREKKLHATRIGRGQKIPVEDLIIFLNNKNYKIPAELRERGLHGPIFKSRQNCWEFWSNNSHKIRCKACLVYINRLPDCISAGSSKQLKCLVQCSECDYYNETYLPKISFVQQIDSAAAVIKDLLIWGGNEAFAEICDLPVNQLPGRGIERFIHSESLATFISYYRIKNLGESFAPSSHHVFLNNKDNGKISAIISVHVLRNPSKACLVIINPEKT